MKTQGKISGFSIHDLGHPNYLFNRSLGAESLFLFNLDTYLIKEIDDFIKEVVGLSATALKGRTIYFFLDSVVRREYIPLVNRLFNHAIALVKDGAHCANLEFGVQKSDGKKATVLFQFQISPSDQELNSLARVIDISHLIDESFPRLFIVDGDGKIALAENERMEFYESDAFNLSRKEIAILSLKNNGLRAKEIARQMGISDLSVYSIIRDVKQKTGMELIPLLGHLKKAGVIH